MSYSWHLNEGPSAPRNMESGKEENATAPAFKDGKSNSFDYIASAKETTTLTLMTEHSGELKGTSTRRYLQQEKSAVYVATSLQKTRIDNTVGEELLEDEKQSVSAEQTSIAPKQRRRGVVQVATEQRHRKNAIAENKQSVHDRTFLRVLHKKF